MSGDRSAQRGLHWGRANNGSCFCLRGIGGTTRSTFCILQVLMLPFRRSRGLRPQPCRLEYFFEFTQGVRAHKSELEYRSLRAGRKVQHPERHFQNPAVLIFQAAVGHSPASSYEARMHPYCTAMPGMKAIANFTHIPNMGVALLSCIITNAIIKARTICCSSLPRRSHRYASKRASHVTSASVVC